MRVPIWSGKYPNTNITWEVGGVKELNKIDFDLMVEQKFYIIDGMNIHSRHAIHTEIIFAFPIQASKKVFSKPTIATKPTIHTIGDPEKYFPRPIKTYKSL